MNTRPGDEIIRRCAEARRLFIVAPYIKANALARVLDAAARIESLTCVTKWDPRDLAMGVSDIECRSIVKKHGGSFRLHPHLHAKYYRMDEVDLIGSANLTFAAMGWSDQPNLEILCRAGDDFDADAFQQHLLKDAREVSDDEFSCWEAVAKTDVGSHEPTVGEQPLLYAWRPSTRDPRHLELAYRGHDEAIASFDEQRAAHRDIQAMHVPTGLNSESFRIWTSTCLLSAPFANAVISLGGTEIQTAASTLAEDYRLSITEARRYIETVQNWLRFFGITISPSEKTIRLL